MDISWIVSIVESNIYAPSGIYYNINTLNLLQFDILSVIDTVFGIDLVLSMY